MNALGFPILSVLLAVPPAAALWILFAPGSEAGRAQNARVIALGATLIDFALGILLWLNFDSSTAAFQFQEDVPLFAPWFSWKLGIDGIALMLIQLSVFLMPICILASWRSIEKRVPEYMARSEEHTSELQSLMRISYAVFCLKKKNNTHRDQTPDTNTA